MMQGNHSGSDTAKAIYEQMNIFDFMDPVGDVSLEDLPEDEMISMISRQTGLEFKHDDHLDVYQTIIKHQKIWVHYSMYHQSVPECGSRRFISVAYITNKGGAGGPCDSIQQAVERVKQYEQSILQQMQNSYKL